ncbi:MAG: hypothetical protein DYG89_38165 [Caldilinea sp. CFX5]|nr:hypothetical protein [Caldilinea sp. CFX5]
MAHHDQSRKITERIHISGTLILQTPAHFGNGNIRGDALVDMALLLDDTDEQLYALIPGTTIAGALRSYLRERLQGYGREEVKHSPASNLFGPLRISDDESAEQSLLIIEDALATTQSITLRDGVRINPKTGTAYEDDSGGAKFDVELLEAGTSFDLHFELLLTDKQPAKKIVPYVIAALEGLDKGEIRLGLRKRRGYGRCQVKEWTVSRYQMRQPTDLCAWLEMPNLSHRTDAGTGTLYEAFAKAFTDQIGLTSNQTDERYQFTMKAIFGLEKSSLLIRSGFGESDMGADFVHLHTLDENGRLRPTIPGTSWAGVVRHRMLRIANTIAIASNIEQKNAEKLVEELFGGMPAADELVGRASRITFDETQIDKGQSLYQTRVRIDRFTGGAFESALFEEAPIYGTRKTRIGFQLHVRNPEKYEIGLLLLVLKDLWTGDLPIGGEVAIGRGRLTGLEANLQLPKSEAETNKTIKLCHDKAALGLNDTQRTELQTYIDALWAKLAEEGSNGR